jgi:hypothetical protein
MSRLVGYFGLHARDPEDAAIADVSVYYFMRAGGPAGAKSRSKRRATLDAIRGKGEPVMESQLVVDHTEIDANGYLTGRASEDSHPSHELWAEARSLDSRASSRDDQVLALGDTGGDRKSVLQAESRELRDKARELRERLSAIGVKGKTGG